MTSNLHDTVSRVEQDGTRHHRKRAMHRRLPPRSSVGQFSFGPTTQTTVVTTTTTTTTNFPPFVMPGPRLAKELDPRQYPLATSATPSALRNINFSLHGKPIVFQEADDAVVKVRQVQEQVDTLERENGTVRSVRESSSRPPTRSRDLQSPITRSYRDLPERPASPDSISSAASFDAQPGTSQRRSSKKIRANGKEALPRRSTLKPHPRILQVQRSNPITPATQTRAQRTSGPRSLRSLATQDPLDQTILPSPDAELQYSPSSPRGGMSFSLAHTDVDDNALESAHRSGRAISRGSHGSVVPTPPVEPEDTPVLERGINSRALSSIPARLQMSQSPSLHDGTLPSPSLSPVTASANAHHNEYFADVDSASEFGSHFANSVRGWNEETPSHAGYESPAATDEEMSDDEWNEQKPQAMSSVADIPSMLTFFEALPDEFKSYVMHQLLRRCPKSTLHVVANAVNPALKCDFLTILPSELSLNILSYLDVQTLCRASQVSRKWRDIINSDESTWKRLFDTDGFTLPQGELQQAISQGWGWQDPHGPNAREVDLSTAVQTATDIEGLTTDSSVNRAPSKERQIGSLRRSKRKASTQLTNQNKMARRLPESSSKFRRPNLDKITVQVSSAEGPNNAANAAILAVPDPALSIPSLKGMHLFKSLYRRHHVIRKNWMSEDLQPHHIAFRAHDSHVVTCLQFDTDKILTGSDDNNINVYETKTGKLRTLLRGHEGGVWALQYIGNTLVSGSTDRSVRVWDIERGQEMQVFRGHTSTVRCLQILEPSKVGETADGKDIMMPKQPLIITGSRDSTLRIWRLPKPTDQRYIQPEADIEADDNPWFVRTLAGHQHSVRAIAAHADTLVSGSYDCSVRVWKISTGETVYRLQGHGQKVYSVVLDHQRNRCISGSMDYMVKIWSLETGCALYTLEGHSSLVGLLDLNCDRLVSAAADSTLRIWDPENGQCKATLSAHTGAITCFQHDAQKVISGSDRTLKMWDIKKGECMKDLLSDLSGVWQVKFNERRCVAAVQRDNMTFIEVLDFGAARDGIPESERGRRIVVDELGRATGEQGDGPVLMEV